MAEYIALVLDISQIIIQFIAAYFAYEIYRFNRLNKGWLAIVIAFFLMGIRRITATLINQNLMSSYTGNLAYLDRTILPLIISALILIGIISMFKNFENFEVVEKKIKNKLKKFKN